MRIASILERTSFRKEPKTKYYIIPEGDKTEIDYFVGIKENTEELNINSLIEVIPVENEECEFGQSHPLKKIENFKSDVENGKFIYDKDIDKACFIVDRDPQNFKDDGEKYHQYQDFMSKCMEYGYIPYVSNPTFELFLIMHSDKILEIDKTEMLLNKKINRNKRFLEAKLSEIFGCNKKKIDFNKFKVNIDIAIKNEKIFCEDVEKLKDELGSNVGKLLEEMKLN